MEQQVPASSSATVRTVASVTGSRKNNLDFIRFVAALLVIFSHSFSICFGPTSHTPLNLLTADRLSEGGLAVGVFFFFGGFLIAKSCVSHPKAPNFFKLRLLRILPQLIFVVVLLTFVVGPVLTSLPLDQYFTNGETYAYLLNGVFFLHHDLPGVFTTNPYGPVVNAPLWTLPVEFACYILCFLCFRWTRFTRRSFALLSIPVLMLLGIYLAFFELYQLSVVRAIILFYEGVAFYVYRDSIPLKASLGWGSIALFCLLVAFGLDIVAMFVVFPYALMWLGYGLPARFANFAKHGEFSYGIYLWGWPIQQTLVLLLPAELSMPWINTILACVIAIGFGVANYYIVDCGVTRLLEQSRNKRTEVLAAELAEADRVTPVQPCDATQTKGGVPEEDARLSENSSGAVGSDSPVTQTPPSGEEAGRK